jgi:predicted transcriptional regulator
MSVIELKSKIIDKVNLIEDEIILRRIYNLISTEPEVYKLSDAEAKAIEIGLRDIDNGRIYTSEEARKIVTSASRIGYRSK